MKQSKELFQLCFEAPFVKEPFKLPFCQWQWFHADFGFWSHNVSLDKRLQCNNYVWVNVLSVFHMFWFFSTKFFWKPPMLKFDQIWSNTLFCSNLIKFDMSNSQWNISKQKIQDSLPVMPNSKHKWNIVFTFCFFWCPKQKVGGPNLSFAKRFEISKFSTQGFEMFISTFYLRIWE